MKQSKYIPGDLVKASGQLCRVEEVFVNRLTKEFEYTLVYPNGNSSRIVIGEIEPVPLTTEILEKNGWEKGEVTGFSGRNYVRCRKDNVMVSFDDTGRITISYDAGNDHASFTFIAPICTHELQHLLFGLGVNSEIKV